MIPDPEDRIGMELAGRYRLTSYRGSGQFCQVYEADILAIGRPVGRCAVRVYRLNSGTNPDRALDVLKLAANLKHPCILALSPGDELDPADEPGVIYATTELCTTSLRRILARQRTLPEDETRTLARCLAEGLAYLHEQGVAHGEVRPSNVLQAGDGWRLSDHEMPRIRPFLLRFESATDTLHFHAPEQVLGQLEAASDLWSLGIVLHECLTGHHPFAHLAASSPTELAYRARQEGPHLDDKLGPDWQALFRGCFRIDPESRWSALDVLEWLAGRTPAEKAPEPKEEVPERPLEPVVIPIPATSPAPADEPKKDGTIELEPLPHVGDLNVPRQPSGVGKALLAGMAVGGVLILAFLGFLVKKAMEPPPRPIPEAVLYPMPYESVKLDNLGRTTAGEAGEAQGYAEELGEDMEPIEMVKLPPGEVLIGAPDNEPESASDERPQHLVALSGFYMGRREITQEQWSYVAGLPQVRIPLRAEPFTFEGENLPVDSVSWDEAMEFCARLSQKSGRPYRLPTEAEWEYACRAGSVTPFYFGDTITPEVACYNATRPYGEGPTGQEQFGPRPVGDFGAANSFGLFDMHGNIQEWCLDFYGVYPPKLATPDPRGPARGHERVLRGGSWFSYPWRCRSAARAHARQDEADNTNGLRIVGDWR